MAVSRAAAAFLFLIRVRSVFISGSRIPKEEAIDNANMTSACVHAIFFVSTISGRVTIVFFGSVVPRLRGVCRGHRIFAN